MMDYIPPRGDTNPDSPWYKEPKEKIEGDNYEENLLRKLGEM